MGKQWVDITTIDNNTPFTKVRWVGSFTSYDDDKWFSEAPGLVTNNMGWRSGDSAAWGWYGGHRMNVNKYTCGFQCDVTGINYGLTPNVYRTHLKDASRSNSAYYDTTVVINGKTYYEVDFSLWDGAAGKSLYAPYSPIPWSVGDIYVEIGVDPIVVDKDRLSFKSSGETKNVVVESDNPWTATTSEAWVTLSTSAGTSGETTLSVTAPEYTSTTEDRIATITITDGVDSVTIDVKQSKYSIGVSNIYLGALNMEAAYLGAIEVASIYLGENLVYSSGPFQGLKVRPSSVSLKYTGGTFELKVKSSEDWTLNYDNTILTCSPSSGDTGETVVVVTAQPNTGVSDISTVITATTVSYTATTNVTINKESALPLPFMFNYNAKDYDTLTLTIPKTVGQLFDEDLVLNKAPQSQFVYDNGYINCSTKPEMIKIFQDAASNPFNRDSNNTEFTMVYKVGNSFTDGDTNLFANRGTTGREYNYMVRGNMFHTSQSGFLSMTPSTSTYIMFIRVKSNGNSERTIVDRNGDVLQTVSASTISWGNASQEINFFNGGGGALTNENFSKYFYWMYLANRELTDSEIQSVIDYNEDLWTDYIKQPLTFHITSPGYIRFVSAVQNNPRTIEYSKDYGNTWTSIASTLGSESAPFTGGTLIQVDTGDVVQFRGQNTYYGSGSYYNSFEGSTCGFYVDGNITSLIYGSSFTGQTTITDTSIPYIFRNFFSFCDGLTSMQNLILPQSMADLMYPWFAQWCTNLKIAPKLPEVTLKPQCYRRMFRGCTSLQYIKCVATNISASNCIQDWLLDANTTGIFVKPASISYPTGTSGIPSGWTIETIS